MDYETLKRSITNCHGKDLDQRKTWYSPAAIAYNQVRPRYPQTLIDRIIPLAHLDQNSRILEVGCGPGTATVSLAPLGCSIVCLEPNPAFYQLAQHNCRDFPNVQICQTSLEEWTGEPGQFDAIVAASSWHWIPPDISYPKAAAALRDTGHLVLLWNKELQPEYEVYQSFAEVYQAYAPGLDRYQDQAMQLAILQGLGQLAIDSGYFQNLVAGQERVHVTYTADEYLMLLTTYSPYLELEDGVRSMLFAGLRRKIEQDLNHHLALSYLSAFHLLQKDKPTER